MTNNEQTDALQFELANLISKFKDEFDLNHQSIIGCLEVAKLDLITDVGVEFIDDEEDDITPHF